MNFRTKLSFLTLALLVGACNEKVSPELQGASSSTSTTGGSGSGGSGNTIVPDEYYFRVVNTADTLLNFKLHKTGDGNANTNCEITNTIGLTSDLFRANPTAYDISCFFEAEELSLYYNGIQMAVEASKNTCPFVGYAPFSYYKRMPGNSTASLELLTCSGGADSNYIRNVLGLEDHDCDTYQDSTILGAGFPRVTSEAELCRFNYTDGGMEQCDTGTITVTEKTYNVTDIGADLTAGTADDTYELNTTSRTVSCGGKVVNCIDGPIRDLSTTKTSMVEVQQAALNTDYTRTITLPKLIDVYNTNKKYVNFRRDLASLDIGFGDSFRNYWTQDLSNAYMSAFSTDPKSYNPALMENYSKNLDMNGGTLATTGYQTFARSVSGTYRALPLAADPYIGMTSSTRTNPFHTFYCFDNALDVRARIRIVIRDWDRVLSTSATNQYFEWISDIDFGVPISKQDVPYTDEVTGDSDSWNAFNDIQDWDDIIDMQRTGGPYDSTTTIWNPYPMAPYTAVGTGGFFNPAWFWDDKIY